MPSSMIVRSAVKLVSNTWSKPARRRAVFISKVTRRAGLEAEALAHGRARRRGGLDDDVLVRVVDGRPHRVGLVLGVQGAGGAAVDALAAVDADDARPGACPRRSSMLGLVAAARRPRARRPPAGRCRCARSGGSGCTCSCRARPSSSRRRPRPRGSSGCPKRKLGRRRTPRPGPAARSCRCARSCSTRRSAR